MHRGQIPAIQEATSGCVSAQYSLVADWFAGREPCLCFVELRFHGLGMKTEKQRSMDPVFSLSSGYKLNPQGGAERSSAGPAQPGSAEAACSTEATSVRPYSVRPFLSHLVRYLCKIKLVNALCDQQL